MQASPFESEAPLGTRRAIIRRNPSKMQEIQMIEASWGLEAWEKGGKPFKFVRSEGRVFTHNRCLIPASEFTVRNGERKFRVTFEDGNFFYLAGIWEQGPAGRPDNYAIATIEANPDIFHYQDRQGAVLLRRQNMAWLDLNMPQDALLRALPARSYRVEEIAARPAPIDPDAQHELAF